jgi:hypothetical protein
MIPLINKPGIYDLTSDVYHGNCTVQPALTSTGARDLVRECPAYFWHRSALNPKREDIRKRHFDIGTAGHFLILEPALFDKLVAVIDADNYQTKLAKKARDAAYDAGLTPILERERDDLLAMRHALMQDETARHAFTDGQVEKSLVWQDKETGVWCKCRPDFLPDHTRYMTDYKTATTANPDKFSKAIHEYGYHIQAAWYLDGVEAVLGERPKRFCFIVQSKEAPYIVTPCWIDDASLEMGAAYCRKARELFATCLLAGEWPSYTAGRSVTVGLPPYAVKDFEERRNLGMFATPAMEAWYRAYAPNMERIDA